LEKYIHAIENLKSTSGCDSDIKKSKNSQVFLSIRIEE